MIPAIYRFTSLHKEGHDFHICMPGCLLKLLNQFGTGGLV